MRVKRSKLKAFIRSEFRRQDLSEGIFSRMFGGGRDRDSGRPSREGGYPPGVEEDDGKAVDRFYSRYADDMSFDMMSSSEAADAFEESAAGFGTDEGQMFSALYWAAGEIPDAESVIEDETSGYEADALMWVATEDKAQELFDISNGEWIFPEEEEEEEEEPEEEEEESGRDKRKLDRQARRQSRQEKRKGRREERREKRQDRREERGERREERREERGERREERQTARAERRDDRRERRSDRREDRQTRREERRAARGGGETDTEEDSPTGRERRQGRREERRGRRRSRRMGDDTEADEE